MFLVDFSVPTSDCNMTSTHEPSTINTDILDPHISNLKNRKINTQLFINNLNELITGLEYFGKYSLLNLTIIDNNKV